MPPTYPQLEDDDQEDPSIAQDTPTPVVRRPAVGTMDAPDLDTRTAANQIQLGINPGQRGLARIAERQRLESGGGTTQGGEGMDAPDRTVRTASLKAQLGIAPTPQEVRRITERQRLEQQAGGLPPDRSVSTLLEGSRLDPRGTRQEQARAAQRAAVEARREQAKAATATTNEFNSETMAGLRAKGARYYTDPATKLIVPEKDEQGRQLYHATPWESGAHPKTGLPMLTKRDQYGQRQYKRPTLSLHPDPKDEFLYADTGDGASVPFMRASEAALSEDISLQRLGLRHQTRANTTARNEALKPVKEIRDAAALEYQMAQAQVGALKGEIEALTQQSAAIPEGATKETAGGFLGIGANPTPAALAAQQQTAILSEQMMAKQAQLDQLAAAIKPGGALHQKKLMADMGIRIAAATAVRDSHVDQEQEILARLRQQGIAPETDPTFLANRAQLAKATAAVQLATKQQDRTSTLLASVTQPVTTAAPAPSPNGGAVAQTAKSAARGATSEGIYAAGEGAARLFSASPVQRAIEGAQDFLTEKVQGFPLTDEQRKTRVEMRRAAAQKTGIAALDETAAGYAEATAALRNQIRKALPVDQAFAEGKAGQIAQGAGQLAGTLPTAVLPGGMAISSVGQIYDEAYQDALGAGATPEVAHSAAMKYLPAAAMDFLSNRLILGRILKPLVGKATVKTIAKDVLATALAEGVTEGAQQAYLNQIASKLEGYDPNRPFDKEVLDSVLVGAVVGGGATAVGQTAARATRGGAEPGAEPGAPEIPPALPPTPPTDVAPPPITGQPAPAPAPDKVYATAEEAIAELQGTLTPEQQAAEAEFQRALTEEQPPAPPAETQAAVPVETPAPAAVQPAAEPPPSNETPPPPTPPPVNPPTVAVPAPTREAAVQSDAAAVGAASEAPPVNNPSATPAASAVEAESAQDLAAKWTESYFKNRNEKPSRNRYQQIYDQALGRYLREVAAVAPPSGEAAAVRVSPPATATGASAQAPAASPEILDFDVRETAAPEQAPAPVESEIDRKYREQAERGDAAQKEADRKRDEAMAALPASEQDPDFWVRSEVKRIALAKGLSLEESRAMHRDILRKMALNSTKSRVAQKKPIHVNAVGEQGTHKGYLPAVPKGYVREGDYYVYKPISPETTVSPTRRENPSDTPAQEQSGPAGGQVANRPNQPFPEQTPQEKEKAVKQANRLTEERYRFATPEVQRAHGIDPKTGLIEDLKPAKPAAGEQPTPAVPKPPTKSSLVREILGERPKDYARAQQWDKNMRAMSKWSVEELQRDADKKKADDARTGKINAGTRELYPELNTLAENAGNGWRTALKERAEAEGITTFNPPTTSTRGEAAVTLARHITERGLSNEKTPAKPVAEILSGDAASPERQVERPAAAEVESKGISDMVTFKIPGPNGPMVVAGRVTRTMPNGKIEVKSQNHGYHVILPGDAISRQSTEIPADFDGKYKAIVNAGNRVRAIEIAEKMTDEEAERALKRNEDAEPGSDDQSEMAGQVLEERVAIAKENATKAADAKSLIARTEPKPRADVDEGTRYTEWRTRKVTKEEYGNFTEGQRRNAEIGGYVTERRTIKTEKGQPDSVGTWDKTGFGKTKAEAIDNGWETSLNDATSLDAAHGKIAEEGRARLKKAADLAKAQADQAKVDAEVRDAYVAEVRATPLKGKQREIDILRNDGNGGETTEKVPAMVYGDWAISKKGEGKRAEYIITHVPSGLKAQSRPTIGEAREIVQGFIHSGLDLSSKDLKSKPETVKKLAKIVQAIQGNGNPAPEWFRRVKDLSLSEKTDTIAGMMDLTEFEKAGFDPVQVTRHNWIDLQRAERRRLGQNEESGTRNAPFADYEEFHKQAVADAIKNGGTVAPEVMADYPELKPRRSAEPAPLTPPKDAAPISANVAPHTPQTIEGAPTSSKWTAFAPDSGTLGVPRAEMPQVKSEARGALVNFLRARDITAKATMVNPSQLKPTQAEFSPAKVEQAREFTGSERPILISADGHVVDGHHQWVAALDDPGTPMAVIKLNAPIDKVLAEMKEFPSTESAKGAVAKSDGKNISEWFGDSKIVDHEGNPQIVYHGERPEGSAISKGGAIYLTPSPETASHYSRVDAGYVSNDKSGRVFPLFLKMEKPLDLRSLGHETTRDKFNDFLEANGVDYRFSIANTPERGEVWQYFSRNPITKESPQFLDTLKKTNDGLILLDKSSTYGDKTGLTYVALDSSQTRSAVGAKRPVATPLLSDRAIAALQKAKVKIDPKDLMKPNTGIDPVLALNIARNAAIDLAILGVRAGRPVEQVVRLAIARFKGKHAAHTPEDLTKLEADIRAAVADRPPEPTPGTDKSKVPESLRNRVGAPAEDIEYDVRAQNERMAEARAIVAKDGEVKAEAAISDRNLPPDTRVGIAGVLGESKLDAIRDAKPEDLPRLTAGFNRIARAMQSGVSTESGQGVAMHNKIYQNLGLGAAMEYVKETSAKRERDLGGKDATDAVKDATDELKGAKTPEDAEKVIEKLKDKHTTKPARKVLEAFQKHMAKVLELNRAGALTRDDMTEIAGKELGIEGADPAKLKRIAEIADRIKNATNHAERSRAELDLANTLAIYKGTSAMEIGSSLLTANILSGASTQAANFEGTALNTITQLGTTALVNPRNIRALIEGALSGIPLGLQQAKSIIATGQGSKDFQDKTGGAGSALSRVDVKRDFPLLGKLSPSVPVPEFAQDYLQVGERSDVATLNARAVEKVFRFMKAVDATFYYPAREAYARLVATKLIEGDYKGAELDQKVSEMLHTTPAAFESAKRQAESEGYSGVDLGRRVSDIIEERRQQTTAGTQAVKESERYAARTTFSEEPVGIAGVAYHALKYAVEEGKLAGIPVLKPWAMFLKTPANVFNTITNYTPIGHVRAEKGMRGPQFRGKERVNFTADERRQMHLQAAIGTTLMTALLIQALRDDKKDMDISAKGPTDPNKRRQLMQAGWTPYSIRVGDKRISYKDSPLLLPLAIVGHVADSVRYQKAKSDMVLESRVVDALAKSGSVIFDTSMLTGLGDLMAAAKDGDVQRVGRTMGGLPANLAIPYNRLLQQIDQTFDPQTYDTGALRGSVPFVRRTDTPKLDVQARPQEYSPWRRFGSTESSDPVDAMLRSKNVFIPEAGKDTKLGNRVMTDPERELYRKISGQRIRVRLRAVAPRLRLLTQEKAQDEIERIAREERERAKPMVRAQAATLK